MSAPLRRTQAERTAETRRRILDAVVASIAEVGFRRTTATEIARRAGVTNGMISLIETNKTSPTVASLKKVLDGIPMSMVEFFTFEMPSEPRHFYAADELPDVGAAGLEYKLVGAQHPDKQMCVLYETYPPGSDTGEDMLCHEGQEGGVVIRGEIEITVGDEVRRLGPGDAFYFDTSLPNRFRNVGDEVCEIVTATTPPNY